MSDTDESEGRAGGQRERTAKRAAAGRWSLTPFAVVVAVVTFVGAVAALVIAALVTIWALV